jgi:hypothetical protein
MKKYPDKLCRRMLRGRGFRCLRVKNNEGKYENRYFRHNKFHHLLDDVFCAMRAERKGVVE